MTVRSDLARGAWTLLLCTLGAASLWALRVPPPRWGDLVTATGSSPALIDAVVFALRGASALAASYLALAAALHLVATVCARRSRAPRLRRAAAQLTPRWMAVATVGVMTGTSWVTPSVGATSRADGGERRPDVVMEIVSDDDAQRAAAPRTMLPWASALRRDPTSPPVTSSALPSTPTTTAAVSTSSTTTTPATTSTAGPPTTAVSIIAPRLEAVEEGPPGDAGSPSGADQLPPPLAIELVPDPGAPAAGRHVVRVGESFWTIAEQVVRERSLSVPVASYWRLLVEANRDRLVDRADPDLIHPGQELVLP
jgi:hypothetical protein